MEYQGSFDECLWELGQKKDAGMSGFTWPDVAEILNQKYNLTYDESVYRKRYRKLKKTAEIPNDLYFDHDSAYNRTLAANAKELEKQRVLLRERQSLVRKAIKQEAFADDFWKELSEKIIKLPAVSVRENQFKIGNREMIAMLSDIHYGLAFTSPYGDYNPKVAEYRVMSYANELCKIARQEHCATIHILLMGDLISGIIHPTIRIENQQNLIEQITGASNLIAVFLNVLAETFVKVTVSSVTGNHSRISPDLSESLRTERLDALIPWFCKAKLKNTLHIIFNDENIDDSIGMIDVLGKKYAFVHGDFDPDLKASASKISNLVNYQVDYMLAGHMHVADFRLENVGYIRNGAVVTGGDDYTTKKRLFGPAVQVCLLASENGVDAVFPIKLS